MAWHVAIPDRNPVLIEYISTSARFQRLKSAYSIASTLFGPSDTVLELPTTIDPINGITIRCSLRGMEPVDILLQHSSLEGGIVFACPLF